MDEKGARTLQLGGQLQRLFFVDLRPGRWGTAADMPARKEPWSGGTCWGRLSARAPAVR